MTARKLNIAPMEQEDLSGIGKKSLECPSQWEIGYLDELYD